MSKTENLLSWCKEMKTFSSVDIHYYKNRNYHLGADRVIRRFAEQGLINRLTNEEIILKGLQVKGRAKIGWWEAK
jgi:hypothetical protein